MFDTYYQDLFFSSSLFICIFSGHDGNNESQNNLTLTQVNVWHVITIMILVHCPTNKFIYNFDQNSKHLSKQIYVLSYLSPFHYVPRNLVLLMICSFSWQSMNNNDNDDFRKTCTSIIRYTYPTNNMLRCFVVIDTRSTFFVSCHLTNLDNKSAIFLMFGSCSK